MRQNSLGLVYIDDVTLCVITAHAHASFSMTCPLDRIDDVTYCATTGIPYLLHCCMKQQQQRDVLTP